MTAPSMAPSSCTTVRAPGCVRLQTSCCVKSRRDVSRACWVSMHRKCRCSAETQVHKQLLTSCKNQQTLNWAHTINTASLNHSALITLQLSVPAVGVMTVALFTGTLTLHQPTSSLCKLGAPKSQGASDGQLVQLCAEFCPSSCSTVVA